MPKRDDLHRILLIGSGPIVIGQACEFDYSGTQACTALKEEGYEVVLVNSNPATVMTDPDLADRTYVEPITVEVLERIIDRERPDALLPTMGGQTALNMAVDLSQAGILEKYGVRLIGATYEAIQKAEDREAFKQAMGRIGLTTPESRRVRTLEEAESAMDVVGFPAIVRPSFTLGGAGGNIAYTPEEYQTFVAWALATSPVNEALIERSLIGWKEYELEVMRDLRDNVVIVCPIENVDAMGIHTGDSITVAPAITLTDKEYQCMRDAAVKIIREIGVDTGGSNIQFGVNPETGEQVVIEMNPRVSRSSALASKATGFPIAKIAAKLAIGYTLDEITNDITQVTKASFEPTIDYVVVKIPRFAFEKFEGADPTLTTHMKSVGEVMALGGTFQEALHKAVRSLEIDRMGLISLNGLDEPGWSASSLSGIQEQVRHAIRRPHPDRLWHVADGFRVGLTVQDIYDLTKIDPWFLGQIEALVLDERRLVNARETLLDHLNGSGTEEGAAHVRELFIQAKQRGFSDVRLGQLIGCPASLIRRWRLSHTSAGEEGRVTYARVDTCAAEFEAMTPYLYSTYGLACEAKPSQKEKVVILGGGPNRIGQGIEFDYCCVHAALALREMGVETIMVNCNPETVSTDYDISDRLYFEPLTEEDVLNIIETEKPLGVVVQFGGQTPLKLALPLYRAGVHILGTSPDAIDRAEDRERFSELIVKLDLKQPDNGTARSMEEAKAIARGIGYPVMVRPSYVLGGRAMQIMYSEQELTHYLGTKVLVSPDHPLLIDQYLSDAIEVDVDTIADGTHAVVAGIMEHVENAGIHSGDSACSLPPYSLAPEIIQEIERISLELAKELQVVGLMNVQYAVRDGMVYILEVNPRGSRTIPFVSKAIGLPIAKMAMKVMMGKTLPELGLQALPNIPHVAVKESVFPFSKLGSPDVLLGPEMRSTGEVMGIDRDFGWAFAKSQAAAGNGLPQNGRVFISVKDGDKPATVEVARRLLQLGFQLQATRGTAAALREAGFEVLVVNKIHEGSPHIVDCMKQQEVHMVINTIGTAVSEEDSAPIRRQALSDKIPYFTTVQGAKAAVEAIEASRRRPLAVQTLQEYYSSSKKES